MECKEVCIPGEGNTGAEEQVHTHPLKSIYRRSIEFCVIQCARIRVRCTAKEISAYVLSLKLDAQLLKNSFNFLGLMPTVCYF